MCVLTAQAKRHCNMEAAFAHRICLLLTLSLLICGQADFEGKSRAYDMRCTGILT